MGARIDASFHDGWVIIPFHIIIDTERKMYIKAKNKFVPCITISFGFLWWSVIFDFYKEVKDGQNIKE